MLQASQIPVGIDSVKPVIQGEVCIAKVVSWHSEHPDICRWTAYNALKIKQTPGITGIKFYDVAASRILLCRNMAVDVAREWGCKYLMFVDPDMSPDCYLGRDPKAMPFWETSWSMLQQFPGSVIAAPALQGAPDYAVNVFVLDPEQRATRRVTHEETMGRYGIEQVFAIGTGLMLIDMSVFDRLKPPYFDDEYENQEKTRVFTSQDIYFCKMCNLAGIRVFANWYAWAGHYKQTMLGRPGMTEKGLEDGHRPSQDSPGLEDSHPDNQQRSNDQ